ncbi:uncharacterized protein EURHEDRAFT_466861 [Aspergillus ruber CBS 135680]|uniref:GPI anchored cell wall protein n=1 Tax=Aspergillus ruber (strain CBS 135680) TaxID=1388766 RepID=A0A017S1X6_ASPRC|nr:uncharacterized protein EURHEDRAFT_466861 [Aspergillus ruber CBS 135680]EYE90624.1 hypothetical protein EURHEDRAFT_466861 [Aspergillus ruber CBS 135680]
MAATTTLAQTTLFPLFNAAPTTLPITGAQGSVVTADTSATTIAIQCIKGNDLCHLNQPITVTEGPSTHSMSAVFSTHTLALNGVATMIEDCIITSSTVGASCTVSLTLELTSPAPTSTSTGSMTASVSVSTTSRTWETSCGLHDIYYKPLTVTAGMEKLNVPTAEPTDAGAGAGENLGIGRAVAAAAAAAAMYV